MLEHVSFLVVVWEQPAHWPITWNELIYVCTEEPYTEKYICTDWLHIPYEIILKRLVKRESDRQGNKLLITEIENCAKITQNNSKANVWYARECEFTKFQQCRSLEVTVTSLRVLLVGVVCHWFQDRQFNAKCNKIKYWWFTSVNNRYG